MSDLSTKTLGHTDSEPSVCTVSIICLTPGVTLKKLATQDLVVLSSFWPKLEIIFKARGRLKKSKNKICFR